MAGTSKVWSLSARPLYAFGVVQALKPPLSNWHSKVDITLGAGEAKTGISTGARIGWLSRDGGIWCYRINGPVIAGRRRVRIAGDHQWPVLLSRLVAVSQAGVRLRSGAGTETATVQLALKVDITLALVKLKLASAPGAWIWLAGGQNGVLAVDDYERCRDDVTAINRQADGVSGADDIAAPIAKAPSIRRCGFQLTTSLQS